MTTVLYKQLKRQVTVDGADHVIAVDPEGIQLTGKDKRRPRVNTRALQYATRTSQHRSPSRSRISLAVLNAATYQTGFTKLI